MSEGEGWAEWVDDLQDEIDNLKAENARLREFRKVVIGWRERDWPSGFDRATAQLIADTADDRAALNQQENKE